MNLAFKQVAVWSIVLFLFSCVNQAEIKRYAPTRTAGILGVVVAPGVESALTQSSMTRELEDLMQAESDFTILRSGNMSRAVRAASPGSFSTMLGNYASFGHLKRVDILALQAAQLPIQIALIARVEKNSVSSSAPKRIVLHNNRGDVLSDRERVVLSTVREMQIQASMIDVASGRVIWSKSYQVTPVSESSYVHYSGSSFSGSLAASVVNTMSNGLKEPSRPAPPNNRLTIRFLLHEIVRNVPG